MTKKITIVVQNVCYSNSPGREGWKEYGLTIHKIIGMGNITYDEPTSLNNGTSAFIYINNSEFELAFSNRDTAFRVYTEMCNGEKNYFHFYKRGGLLYLNRSEKTDKPMLNRSLYELDKKDT